MNGTKPIWRSKTAWTCVITAVIGLYETARAAGYELPPIPGWIITVLAALGLYGRITATEQIRLDSDER